MPTARCITPPDPMSATHERTLRDARSWFRLDLAALWRYRDLLYLLVRRDFVSRYQQTILGPLWFLIQPLITTVVFTVVFGRVLRAPTDGLPPFLFYLCGMLGWGYFFNAISGICNTFSENTAIFTKVYFPRLIVPLASVLTHLATFAVQAVLFLGFYLYFELANPSAHAFRPDVAALLLLPLALLQSAALALGGGLITSSLSAKYRDLQHAVPFFLQLWIYATPVVYPLSHLGPRGQWLASLNPMTSVVECFRRAFFGTGTLSVGYALLSVASTLVILTIGLILFQRTERTYADLA